MLPLLLASPRISVLGMKRVPNFGGSLFRLFLGQSKADEVIANALVLGRHGYLFSSCWNFLTCADCGESPPYSLAMFWDMIPMA